MTQVQISNAPVSVIALQEGGGAVAIAAQPINVVSLSALGIQGPAGEDGTLSGFVNRAAAIAWLATGAAAVGNVFYAEGYSYRYTGVGTDIPDMPGCVPHGNASVVHWGVSSGLADVPMAAAIAWLNAASGRSLELPEGVISIAATLPPITATYATIAGRGTRLAMSNNGAFLVFGTSALPATSVSLSGIVFNANGTPGPNDFCIDLVNAVEVDVDDCGGNNLASIVRFGSATAATARCDIKFSRGVTFGAGANADSNILVVNDAGSSLTVTGNNGTVPSNGNPTGAMMRIKPVAGGLVDTFRLNGISMQSYTSEVPGAYDGKPYGLVIDMTNGPVTNVWSEGANYFDHTTVCGVQIIDAATSTYDSRAMDLSNLRIATDAGKVLHLDKKSAASVVWRGWKLNRNFFVHRDASDAVTIEGAGFLGCSLIGNYVGDTTPGTAKPRAILLKSDGWLVTDNLICSNVNAASGYLVGVEIGNTGIVDLTVLNNPCQSPITPVVQPTYSTAISTRRNVSGLGGPIDLAGQNLNGIGALSFLAWGTAITALSGTTLVCGASGLVTTNITAGGTVTDLTTTLPGRAQITIYNSAAASLIFQFATGKLRTIGKTDVVLDQYEAITFVNVAGTAWQQIGGKAGTIKTFNLADDAIGSFTLPFAGGFAEVVCAGQLGSANPFPQYSGQVWYDASSTPEAIKSTAFAGLSANLDVVTADLVSPADGTDGNVTVSIRAGLLKILNRSGATREFRVKP